MGLLSYRVQVQTFVVANSVHAFMRKVDTKCHNVDLEGRDKERHEIRCEAGKTEIIVMPVTHYRHVRGAQFICIKKSFQTTFVQ